MADDKPRANSNRSIFDDDDDDDDLFKSAVETQPNQSKPTERANPPPEAIVEDSNEIAGNDEPSTGALQDDPLDNSRDQIPASLAPSSIDQQQEAQPQSTTAPNSNSIEDGDEINLDDEPEPGPQQQPSSTYNPYPGAAMLPSAPLKPSATEPLNGPSKVNGGDSHTLDDRPKATLPTSSSTTQSSITPQKIEPMKPHVLKPDEIQQPKSSQQSAGEHFIEITVGDPQKIGEGMGSYVVYKVITKTNLPFFRKTSFSVSRRFSDFLGLRDKLAEKHIHLGRIVPPAPEKNAYGMVQMKMSKEESAAQAEFIEKRRAALERFLNRIAAHPNLRTDPDFREFLEYEADLPKSSNTSALSGAGVRRLFNRVGDSVNKMTFRMDESDPWFEDKQHQIESLDQQMRKLLASVEALIHHRKELTLTTSAFARSAAMLGNCEEHTSLSCALSQLAETEEKLEQLYGQQVNHDFFLLGELIRDYIALIGSVKDVFHQRVKVFQTWQHAIQMLNKKREQKAKLELAHRTDKVSLANEEVAEWEAKVNRGQEEFESISKNIKVEVERFELQRIKDFKNNIIKYMECLLETQQQIIRCWETFLPEVKTIG